jgi:cystathionine beta-synthase
MRKLTNNLLDAIGNTPLVKIPFDAPVQIFAKLEYLNPGGSVKDRSALFMIEEAEKSGALKPGGTIIEATSGNQGVAISMIGAVKGYKVIITVSEKVSEEKVKTLKAYGAEAILCPNVGLDHPDNYHTRPLLLQKEIPNSFVPNQYFNLSNPEAYYTTLGPEIWEQTKGKITHFFAAAGTGGTISGVGRFLKEKNPNIKVIAVDVDNSFHSTKGNPKPYKMEGIGIDFETPCLDESVIDEFVPVSDEQSFAMLKIMASKFGLFLGTSGGAVAHAVSTYADKLTKDDLAVVIFADSGRAYLSKNYY